MENQKYANVQIQCKKCGNLYIGPFHGSKCPYCGHCPDHISIIERLIMFFIPIVGVVLILIDLSNPVETKQRIEATLWGFAFYIILALVAK
ncbi:MAG: hypothetical protein P4L35_01495 [Ignavibacteriaceae bacterium]|nr:hypothetical protein [Ignavibacteriaceae bacterium]